MTLLSLLKVLMKIGVLETCVNKKSLFENLDKNLLPRSHKDTKQTISFTTGTAIWVELWILSVHSFDCPSCLCALVADLMLSQKNLNVLGLQPCNHLFQVSAGTGEIDAAKAWLAKVTAG